LIPWGDGPNL